MYPFEIVLVNCGESIRSHVRREMSNQLAPVKSEFADVTSLLQKYGGKDRDEHFLLVYYLRTPDDLPQLERLSKTFPRQPILALRDRDSEQTLFNTSLRAGAAFTIPVPLDPEDLRTALNWIARQLGRAPRETKLVAVTGVSSGTGATSVALNLAHELATGHERSVLLVELALRMGVLATYTHTEPKYGMLDVLQQGDQLDIEYLKGAVTPFGNDVGFLAGPQQAIHCPAVDLTDVQRVLFYARTLADVVVVDVPASYDDLYFETLVSADHVVLLWEQKVLSVRALQMVSDALHLRGASASQRTLVLNRYDPRLPGFSTADLEKLLRLPPLRTIAKDYTGMNEAINNGQPLRRQAPASPALADIAALATGLVRPAGTAPTARAAQRSVLSRLVSAFGLSS